MCKIIERLFVSKTVTLYESYELNTSLLKREGKCVLSRQSHSLHLDLLLLSSMSTHV